MLMNSAAKLLRASCSGRGRIRRRRAVGTSSHAETDAVCRPILTLLAGPQGIAGVSLGGATLRPDKASNKELYRGEHTNQQIVMGRTTPPAAASGLRSDLTKYSARKE